MPRKAIAGVALAASLPETAASDTGAPSFSLTYLDSFKIKNSHRG
jgi:hypothetical protein